MAEECEARLLLDGIVVLDLTRVLAGPFCTLVLAQQGARVVKVELPSGDDARGFGPFVGGKSLYFSSINYDKESIALDLKKPPDREIFEGLLDRADVLVENFRPGTMDKLGYDWPRLHQRRPRLIYAAVSGFGASGPYARRPAYDMVVQAMGGMMSLTGRPGGPPTRVGASIGDMTAGLFLSTGVCAALYEREKTGRGVKIDVAMLDCQVAILENALTRYLCTGEIAGPLGARHSSIAPFEAYRTADGWLVIAAGNDRLYAMLCRSIERRDLIDDVRFQTNPLRMENVEALRVELESALGAKGTADWLALLTEAGVPCGPVNNVADVAADPQVAAREMIQCIEDPAVGRLYVAGNPIKIVGRKGRRQHRPPPEIDADRRSVLAWLSQPGEEPG